MPRPLSLIEAAAKVDRDPASLRQAILRGSLKAEKIGRDWFVKHADLKRYLGRAAQKRIMRERRKADK